MEDNREWKSCEVNAFWKTVAVNNHVVQLYDAFPELLKNLSAYAIDGFEQGDSFVMIANPEHIALLNQALTDSGYDVQSLIAENKYITLNASETLAQFMVNGMPDKEYFFENITGVLNQARAGGNQVRAYGEMVVSLWEKGDSLATLKLEEFWNELVQKEKFGLFCAYPKSCFENDASASVMHICGAHTHILDIRAENTQLRYKQVG